MKRELRAVERAARLAREYTHQRDLAICTASEAKFSLREIAEAADMSHAGIAKILGRVPQAAPEPCGHWRDDHSMSGNVCDACGATVTDEPGAAPEPERLDGNGAWRPRVDDAGPLLLDRCTTCASYHPAWELVRDAARPGWYEVVPHASCPNPWHSAPLVEGSGT